MNTMMVSTISGVQWYYFNAILEWLSLLFVTKKIHTATLLGAVQFFVYILHKFFTN